MEGEQIAYINVFFVLYGLKYSIVLCMVRSCHCIVTIIFLYIVCADEKICTSSHVGGLCNYVQLNRRGNEGQLLAVAPQGPSPYWKPAYALLSFLPRGV